MVGKHVLSIYYYIVVKKLLRKNGFTLIEILVVIGIIAILAAIVLVSINPAKRFQDARNSQRRANVESILSAVQQDMVDNKGISTCTTITNSPKTITSDTATGVDLSGCLSKYLSILPVDPKTAGAHWTSATDYNTGYRVSVDTSTSQITIDAPEATSDGVPAGISVTR